MSLQILRNLTTKADCKSCGPVSFKDFFCVNCEDIIESSEINKLNYFKMFDLPPQFDINKKALEVKFREYQKIIHPDKYLSKDDNQYLYNKTKEIVILINSAYKFLLKDFDRANYVLEIKGENYVKEDSQCDDIDLLEEFLDANEELMELVEKEELEDARGQINEKLGILMADIASDLNKELYKEAYLSLSRCRFFERQIEMIDKK